MKRIGLAGLIAALFVLSPACNKKEEAPPVEAQRKLELVSKAEIEALEKRLMAEVEKNRVKKCPRPVLRGEPLPGRADEDILFLLAPTDAALLECLDKVEAHNDRINDYLARPAAEPPLPIIEVLVACSALPDVLSRAVRHEDACSPFLAGRRGLTRMIHLIRFGKAVALLATDAAGKGDYGAAFDMSLDFLRLGQDLSRGGAPLIAAMVGVAAQSAVVQGDLRSVLNGPGEIPVRTLSRFSAELDALIETEPLFGSFFAYERHGNALHMILPDIKGRGWAPPGGYDDDFDPEAYFDRQRGEEMEGLDAAQQLGLAWIATDHSMSALQEACPPDLAPVPCYRGLVAAAKKKADQAAEGLWGRALRVMLQKDPGPEIRKWLIDIIQGIGAPVFTKYVPRYSLRDFYTRTLRLHSAIVAARQRTGECPTLEELGRGNWAELTIDGSGGTLRISSLEGGKLVVAPASGFEDSEDDWHRDAEYVIECRRP